jgi:hypothetical protein
MSGLGKILFQWWLIFIGCFGLGGAIGGLVMRQFGMSLVLLLLSILALIEGVRWWAETGVLLKDIKRREGWDD